MRRKGCETSWREWAPTSVFLMIAGIRSDFVELLDLLDGLVVQRDDILAANIRSSILLQKQKLVANDREASKNSLLPGVPRCWYCWCIHTWAVRGVVCRTG